MNSRGQVLVLPNVEQHPPPQLWEITDNKCNDSDKRREGFKETDKRLSPGPKPGARMCDYPWSSYESVHQSHLYDLWGQKNLDCWAHPRFSDWMGQGWGLVNCIFKGSQVMQIVLIWGHTKNCRLWVQSLRIVRSLTLNSLYWRNHTCASDRCQLCRSPIRGRHLMTA